MQFGAIEALKNGKDDALPMREEYRVRGLYHRKDDRFGYKIIKPDGAFYIFAKIPADFNQDSFSFLQDFAGKGCGLDSRSGLWSIGEGYVRFPMRPAWKPSEAMKRLKEYMEECKG